MELHFNEYSTKIESLNVLIIELQSSNNRLQQDRNNMEAELEHAQSQANGSSRFKQQYQRQVDEITHNLEEETRLRLTMTQQFKSVSEDYQSIKMLYEEEIQTQSDLRAKLARVTSECLMWKSKFESENLIKTEELDECKKKFALKMAEAEDQVEQALLKCASLEKAKIKLQNDMEDLLVDVERANSSSSSMEKRQRQLDKMIADWKLKCESITVELEASQREARQYSGEVFKLRSQLEESLESIEMVRRENRSLIEEVKSISGQMSEEGRSLHELERAKRKLEQEKAELQLALEEAERQHEAHDGKVNMLQFEISNIR